MGVFRKLPADFDADRYTAAYPDVLLSGLTPQQHYLQFGRSLGRSPSGKVADPVGLARPESVGAKLDDSQRNFDPLQAAPNVKSEPLAEPIIERPPDFDPADVVSAPALPRSKANEDGTLTLEVLASGPFADGSAAQAAPLANYAKLLSLDLPAQEEWAVGRPAEAVFREGAARIENAWFAAPTTIRLMVGGAATGTSAAAGWSLRAYQATADDPGCLLAAGDGVRFPASGPVFVDVELVDPLMPLLLELADKQNATLAMALWPFPSLLPGGLHAAEMKALQNEPNPMDAFWTLSDALLTEAICQSGPARSITEIGFHEGSERGDVAAFPAAVKPWLTAVFGLSMAKTGKRKNQKGDVKLLLPAGSIPTIAALASRRLTSGSNGRLTGPLLITGGERPRPRWSVALPSSWPDQAAFPALEGRRVQDRSGSGASSEVPAHLAIANRQVRQATMVDRQIQSGEALAEPVSVVLESTDQGRSDRIMETLRRLAGKHDLDLHTVSAFGDLGETARHSKHELILTVCDRMQFEDVTIEMLRRLLRADDSAASASCMLVGGAVIKKDRVTQPSFGGLFPAGVSFSSSPRLAFSQPDVFEALVGTSYPVVANTFDLTLWKVDAIARLPAMEPTTPLAADIRLGLDLMELGYRNLCTTAVSARIEGPYARRDMIDPVGAAYLHPERWARILNNVTVIRELF